MLKIDNLSNDIDANAVHGGSLTGVQAGSGQFVSGGPGSLNIAVQVDPQIMNQESVNVINNNLTNVFGQMDATIAQYLA